MLLSLSRDEIIVIKSTVKALCLEALWDLIILALHYHTSFSSIYWKMGNIATSDKVGLEIQVNTIREK